MKTTAEIFHYQQVIHQCSDGGCCGGDICSVKIDVHADDIPLMSKQITPWGSVDFAVPADTTVVIAATPMQSGGQPTETFTRQFDAGSVMTCEGAGIFGELAITKKVTMEE